MIYGERIRLRRDEHVDLPKFVEWLNDPEVCRYLGAISLPFSMDNEEQWFENMLKRSREEQPFAIEVREGDEWQLVGNCGFFDINWRYAVQKWGFLSVINPAGTKDMGLKLCVSSCALVSGP